MRALLALLGCGPLVACSSGSPTPKPDTSSAASASPPAAASLIVIEPRKATVSTATLYDGPVPSARPFSVDPTPAGPAKASCDMRAKRGTCFDFYTPGTTEKIECEGLVVGGTYATKPCPTDKSLGYCTTSQGDRRHYYDGPAPEGFGRGVPDAEKACETRRFTPR